jgi:hypothetical protein
MEFCKKTRFEHNFKEQPKFFKQRIALCFFYEGRKVKKVQLNSQNDQFTVVPANNQVKTDSFKCDTTRKWPGEAEATEAPTMCP